MNGDPGNSRFGRWDVDGATSLTSWEWIALGQPQNLADGHAHGLLNEHQVEALGDLTRLFLDSEALPQQIHEHRFLSSLFALARQSSPPTGKALLHYSASTSIEIVGKALRSLDARRVSLPSPTFDNIPLLLKRAGLEPQSLPEDFLLRDEAEIIRLLQSTDAVFMVLPNNPTGFLPPRESLERLFTFAAELGVIVACDYSFRFFSELHTWDQYALAAELKDLQYIFLEDTGKTWPARELKVSVCTTSDDLYSLVKMLTDELLLNVSPFTLGALTRLIGVDIARCNAGGAPSSVGTVTCNRLLLRESLAGTPVRPANIGSTICVEWLHLPEHWDAASLCQWLTGQGVGVLPGGPFYWDDPSAGRNMLRVALMRQSPEFSVSAKRLGLLLRQYQGG